MDLVNGLKDYDKKRFADPYGNGVQRFDRLTKYVDMAVKGLGDNTASAIEVAKALYCIREEKLYEDYPVPGAGGVSVFQDFNSFCREVFKCQKSTVYNYIALYERFGAGSGAAVEFPLPRFNVSQYTYTQLLLMLPLSDTELLQVEPSWTCSQIKKHVKEVKEKNRLNSNRLEKTEDETEEQVEEAEASQYETFMLNNDEARRGFLKTYKRWTKCIEFDIINTHLTFYTIELVENHHLVAVSSSLFNAVSDYVSFFLFNSVVSDFGQQYGFYGSCLLRMGWGTSDNEIIKFLRDRKIKSINIRGEI